MAKRNHLPHEQPREYVDLNSVIKAAKNQEDAPRLYANHATFSITMNEIHIDLYRIEPNEADSRKIKAVMLQRLIIPIGLAKGFATALANLIAGYEKITGLKIPNNRTRDESDAFVLWDDQ
jgi:hypothetical protein